MAETSYMARFGARLVTNGYAILPIGPGTKKPGRFQRGAWTDYPEWNRHAERPTTEVEVTTWSAWPECGIGIVGGAVAAVDIDIVEDPELALQIEQLARQRLGDTPALRIGRAPKRMLIYRTAAPFRGIKHHPLEVLCLGQQFLAYADHPDTCAPYVWPEEGLADLDITDLPEITTETAAAFLDEAYALLPESLRQRGFSAMSPAAEHLRSHNQVGTRPAIQAALEWLPNVELDYDSWMRVGMALKGALGEAGKDLFAKWSAQAAKDVPATTAKAWTSFKPDRIGAGTVYHLAMERGWQPDASLRLDGSLACDDKHPAAGLLSRLDGHPEEGVETPASPPFELEMPDGLVGELTDYMLSTARRPQPLLSLGASLCAIGALMGRQYRTESNLRSNLYVVGIADSGSGKNHAREIINEVFFEAGLAHHLGGNKIASGAGLLGEANTPAYRGTAYVVFEDLPLGNYGRRDAGSAGRDRDQTQDIWRRPVAVHHSHSSAQPTRPCGGFFVSGGHYDHDLLRPLARRAGKRLALATMMSGEVAPVRPVEGAGIEEAHLGTAAVANRAIRKPKEPEQVATQRARPRTIKASDLPDPMVVDHSSRIWAHIPMMKVLTQMASTKPHACKLNPRPLIRLSVLNRTSNELWRAIKVSTSMRRMDPGMSCVGLK